MSVAIVVLAGSEPTGRVGLLRDQTVLGRLGLAGRVAAVETAWTAQPDGGPLHWEPVQRTRFRAQVEALAASGERPLAAKVGMVGTSERAVDVAWALDLLRPRFTVVDPVLSASRGAPLADAGLVDGLVRHVLPATDLLTPNLAEAEALTGLSVRDEEGMLAAGRRLLEVGCRAVLLKGGHLAGDPVDLLVLPGEVLRFASQRVRAELRGTGCRLASATAGLVALGAEPAEAVRRARLLVQSALLRARSSQAEDPAHHEVLTRVQEAADRLCALADPRLLPEVGINVAEALPSARGTEAVAALDGRIVATSGGAAWHQTGKPSFGGSSHVARVVLAAKDHAPGLRAAVNLACNDEVLDAARAAGLALASFDRAGEPSSVAQVEGASLPWGVARALRATADSLPDIIWDSGGPGREPMVRLLGPDAAAVSRTAGRLAAELQKGEQP
jgi:hydroxymethylpyrimidine/phosphomethylpyrimidine kinase